MKIAIGSIFTVFILCCLQLPVSSRPPKKGIWPPRKGIHFQNNYRWIQPPPSPGIHTSPHMASEERTARDTAHNMPQHGIRTSSREASKERTARDAAHNIPPEGMDFSDYQLKPPYTGIHTSPPDGYEERRVRDAFAEAHIENAQEISED